MLETFAAHYERTHPEFDGTFPEWAQEFASVRNCRCTTTKENETMPKILSETKLELMIAGYTDSLTRLKSKKRDGKRFTDSAIARAEHHLAALRELKSRRACDIPQGACAYTQVCQPAPEPPAPEEPKLPKLTERQVHVLHLIDENDRELIDASTKANGTLIDGLIKAEVLDHWRNVTPLGRQVLRRARGLEE